MPDLFGNPQRRGSQGRPSDAQREYRKVFQRVNVSLPPELYDRCEKYCIDDERSRSYVIQKALDEFLTNRGY